MINFCPFFPPFKMFYTYTLGILHNIYFRTEEILNKVYMRNMHMYVPLYPIQVLFHYPVPLPRRAVYVKSRWYCHGGSNGILAQLTIHLSVSPPSSGPLLYPLYLSIIISPATTSQASQHGEPAPPTLLFNLSFLPPAHRYNVHCQSQAFPWCLYQIVAHFTLRTNDENNVLFREKKSDLTILSM